MAVTGTGTQADPYVVTTYGSLVDKASEADVFIELANDINIEAEYPEHNAPRVYVGSRTIIDGKNKKISNWMNGGEGNFCIGNSTSNDYESQFRNLTFANINTPSGVNFIHYDCSRDGQNPHFYNCKFYGKIYANPFGGDARTAFKNCSLNIERKDDVGGGYLLGGFNGFYFNNCYVRLKWVGNANPVFSDYTYPNCKDSYLVLEGSITGFSQYQNGFASNCVLDIITNSTISTGNNSGVDLSIFNSTNGPNISGGNNIKGVDDTHWLDTDYLASIGFNAG